MKEFLRNSAVAMVVGYLCGWMVEDYRQKHEGTKRILLGGIWEDDSNNIYNCYGEKIGKVTWEEGFGG